MKDRDSSELGGEDRTLRAGIVFGRHAAVKRELAHRFRRKMTEAEAVLWNALRANRLNGLHFRRQQIIDGFIVDFFCLDAALVVEVDGLIHEDRVEYDALREAALRLRKLSIVRCTNDEVLHDLPAVLHRIGETAGLVAQPPNNDEQ